MAYDTCVLGRQEREGFKTYMDEFTGRQIEATPHFFMQSNLLQLGNSKAPLWLLRLLQIAPPAPPRRRRGRRSRVHLPKEIAAHHVNIYQYFPKRNYAE